MAIKTVFTDFDGTITEADKSLTRTFFDIIELTQKHGVELVVVSGRSLSWGHFLLTHFPFKYAIMEGGGVILEKNGRLFEETLIVSEHDLQNLAQITEELLNVFPQCPLSSDSFGRKTDRAIEFELMHDNEINEVIQFLKTQKANYSKSNVHINYWCGEVSKYLGVKKFLEKTNKQASQSVFFGDAPNDESMFEFFEQSVGVSNIEHCLDKLSHYPQVILKGEKNRSANGVLNYLLEKL